MRYAAKWPEYKEQWDRMAIVGDRIGEFDIIARYAIRHKQIYQQIEERTGVKWYHIAVLHRRESDGDFRTYLGNGQPLSHRTTIVPKHRGPFKGPDAFVDGAIDALAIDGLSSVIDWRLEKILYYCEAFNGWGYAHHGIPSPYIFGGTNIQKPGKFVSDGVFSHTIMDPQPGCAPMLWMIAHLDPTVYFTREI